jgi:hypothetical protein
MLTLNLLLIIITLYQIKRYNLKKFTFFDKETGPDIANSLVLLFSGGGAIGMTIFHILEYLP